jgi:hypothetical protein
MNLEMYFNGKTLVTSCGIKINTIPSGRFEVPRLCPVTAAPTGTAAEQTNNTDR